MDNSVWEITFQVLGTIYKVTQIAPFSRLAEQSARKALLREHPDLRQANVIKMRCWRVGAQVEEMDDSDVLRVPLQGRDGV